MNIISKIGLIIFGCALGYVLFFLVDSLPRERVMNAVPSHNNAHETQSGHTAHDLVDIDTADPVPSFSVGIIPDMMSGYNIHITTENFNFAPSQVNKAVVPNEGHAHIYVNDEKISRIYGSWFHLDEHHIVPGENRIRVTLNANNHSEWAIDGAPIEFTTVINHTE